MANQTILLTGGSGRLGRELIRLDPAIIAPRRAQLDVMDALECGLWASREEPAVIIHAAALPSVIECEKARIYADCINIAGTINMLLAAASIGARFVFISTEYVFSGGPGHYKEDSTPHPINHYGWTKFEAEKYSLSYDKTLVLRAPFRAGPPWPYPRAFSDQWTSSRFPAEVAPDVLKAARGSIRGILHLGGPRVTMLELARRASPDVGELTLQDFCTDAGILLPRDVSLNSDRWERAQRTK